MANPRFVDSLSLIAMVGVFNIYQGEFFYGAKDRMKSGGNSREGRKFFSVLNKIRLYLPESDLICEILAEGSITFNERCQVALKGLGNKRSGGGKKGIDARIAKYSDAQRKKSKAIAETVKPQRKK